MRITNVLAAIAVTDIERSRPWCQVFFGRAAGADPMPGLTEGRFPRGTIQLVADRQRAGGSLATPWVADARREIDELTTRGGPAIDLDDTTSDNVLFATITDPDGNAITVVEVRSAADL